MDRAEVVLKEGYEKFPQDPQLQKQLHELLIDLANSRWQHREGNPQESIERLLLAAQMEPDDTTPVILLGNMAVEPGEFGEFAMQFVRQILDNGQAPPKLYAVVAPLVGLKNDLPTAIRYLRKAIELDPEDSYSLNNLAFCLLEQGNDHNQEVLDLVNRRLAIEPDQAMYRETRGQVLLRLGQYQEAIDDLTFALNGMGDQPSIHAALATAYERLGQPEQARIHQLHSRESRLRVTAVCAATCHGAIRQDCFTERYSSVPSAGFPSRRWPWPIYPSTTKARHRGSTSPSATTEGFGRAVDSVPVVGARRFPGRT